MFTFIKRLFSPASTSSIPNLVDSIAKTKAIPPPWQVQGPDGSMTQLDGDVRHWLARRDAGMTWPDYVVAFGAVAGRIRRQYPLYIIYGSAQLVTDWMADQGITSQGVGLARYKRFVADPMIQMKGKWQEFFGDWEVNPKD
jgi:hypothetical protein